MIAPLRWDETRAPSKSCSGVAIDIIKSYGQIDEARLKTVCERFCKADQANAESHAKQNSTMMSMCRNKLLTATAKASLLTYRAEYTFDGIEYTLPMYKIIMCIVTVDSVTTTLGMFAVTVEGDIEVGLNCSLALGPKILCKCFMLFNLSGLFFPRQIWTTGRRIHISKR